jgi:hypothetical protein
MVMGDNETQVLNALLLKLALLGLQVQFVAAKLLENPADYLTMLFEGLREDENVIEVNDNMPLCNKVCEDVIHHGLEGRRRICESEEHY